MKHSVLRDVYGWVVPNYVVNGKISSILARYTMDVILDKHLYEEMPWNPWDHAVKQV